MVNVIDFSSSPKSSYIILYTTLYRYKIHVQHHQQTQFSSDAVFLNSYRTTDSIVFVKIPSNTYIKHRTVLSFDNQQSGHSRRPLKPTRMFHLKCIGDADLEVDFQVPKPIGL